MYADFLILGFDVDAAVLYFEFVVWILGCFSFGCVGGTLTLCLLMLGFTAGFCSLVGYLLWVG